MPKKEKPIFARNNRTKILLNLAIGNNKLDDILKISKKAVWDCNISKEFAQLGLIQKNMKGYYYRGSKGKHVKRYPIFWDSLIRLFYDRLRLDIEEVVAERKLKRLEEVIFPFQEVVKENKSKIDKVSKIASKLEYKKYKSKFLKNQDYSRLDKLDRFALEISPTYWDIKNNKEFEQKSPVEIFRQALKSNVTPYFVSKKINDLIDTLLIQLEHESNIQSLLTLYFKLILVENLIKQDTDLDEVIRGFFLGIGDNFLMDSYVKYQYPFSTTKISVLNKWEQKKLEEHATEEHRILCEFFHDFVYLCQMYNSVIKIDNKRLPEYDLHQASQKVFATFNNKLRNPFIKEEDSIGIFFDKSKKYHNKGGGDAQRVK